MIGPRWRRAIVAGGLILASSLLSLGIVRGLGAQAQSWWEHDRIRYLGKSAADQRQAIFELNDLDVDFLRVLPEVSTAWPLDARYRVEPRGAKSSYAEYLLAPRVPVAASSRRLVMSSSAVFFEPAADEGVEPVAAAHPLGVLVAMLTVIGAGYAAMRVGGWPSTGIPRLCALGSTLLVLLLLSAKFLTGTSTLGMLVFALVGLGGFAGLLRNGLGASGPGAERAAVGSRGVALAIASVPVAISLLHAVVAVPDEWDAWAIWGPKAKVLALGTGSLQDVVHFTWRDYPLAWPSVWAYSGWLGRGWEEVWVGAWGTLFLALTAWEGARLSARLAGDSRAGLVAGLLFVTSPLVVQLSSWKYAEPLLWLMLICAANALADLQRSPTLRGGVLVGILAAGAALTKNEGMLFACLLVPWCLVFVAKGRRRVLVGYLTTLAILLGPWVLWTRVVLRMSTHAAFLPTPEHFRRSVARLPDMLAALGREATSAPVETALVVFGLGIGVLLWRNGSAAISILTIPAAMYAAYAVLLLTHRLDIEWLVWSAWPRLLVQPLPIVIAAAIAALWRVGPSSPRGVRVQ